jgi:triosephosphate isomerase (TIM)
MAPPPRRRIVGVSTKMYFSAARTAAYTRSVLSQLSHNPSLLDDIDVFILPDHITLGSVISQVQASSTPKVLVGAQNASHADDGAHTGEVSPQVLAEVGCRIVMVGHAERRRVWGETDAHTTAKAAAVVRNGLVPLVCIGEQREGDVDAAVRDCGLQVEAVLAAVPDEAEVILAYEPIWAIGAAEPAGAEYVLDVVRDIRALGCVQRRKGLTRIVYGGSAGPGLFEKLKEGVDGLFLGRFGHDPEQFYKTVLEVASA